MRSAVSVKGAYPFKTKRDDFFLWWREDLFIVVILFFIRLLVLISGEICLLILSRYIK